MKLIRRFVLGVFMLFVGVNLAFGSVSADCEKYTDCDMLVACELALQVENGIAGLAADYEGAVANAASYRTACSTYPDKFKKNIDVVVSNNPEVRIAIDWGNVRKRMQYGAQAGFSNYDVELVRAMVDGIFGPDTEAQKNFFDAVATEYVRTFKSDNSLFLDDAFVLDFLGSADNFEKYRTGIRGLNGETYGELDTDYGTMKIDVTWDDVLMEVSNILDKIQRKRGAIVCENNRSYQAGIDAAGWIVTAVAAVLTFYTGGAGGAAVAAGRAALGTGLKASAKALAKVGVKGAARKISKAGSKQLAKSAIKISMKSPGVNGGLFRGWANYAGKGVLKKASETFVVAVRKGLTNKWAAIAASSAAIWGLGSAASTSSGGGTFYSLLNSDLDKSFLNCHDLDHNEGCYHVCGDGSAPQDYLNNYVLKPILGKMYCVNPTDYALYEINPDGSRGDLLLYDSSKHKEIISRIKSQVKDKSNKSGAFQRWGCDYNEDDIDMYFGFYIYDPDTLELTKEAMVIDDAIRLDD